MGDLLDKVNHGDRLVALAREGLLVPCLVLEQFVSAGFYDVELIKEGFRASYNGVTFTFKYEHKGLLL